MLTPEQARELVDHFGSQRLTSRAVGVPRSTLQHWLNPAPARDRAARSYWRNPEAARERVKNRYYALDALGYARVRLQNRRNKAIDRMAKRAAERQARNGSI